MENNFKYNKEAAEYKNTILSRVAKKGHPFLLMKLEMPMAPKYTKGQMTLIWEKFQQMRDFLGRNLVSYPMIFRSNFGSVAVAFLSDNINTNEIKKQLSQFEDMDFYAKILDFEVYTIEKNGHREILRSEAQLIEKNCIVCGKSQANCVKQSTHTKEQVRSRMLAMIEEYHVIRCALNSLYEGIALDPKPGLITPTSKGIFNEIDYELLKKSFHIISNELYGFYRLYPVSMAEPDEALSEIREHGIEIEKRILKELRIQTPFKGLLFALATSLYSIGYLYFNGQLRFVGLSDEFKNFDAVSNVLRDLCHSLLDDYELDEFQKSKSKEMFEKYDLKGLRGELSTGLQSVFARGLPYFISQIRQGNGDKEYALKKTIIFMTAFLDDTNILQKAGPDTLNFVKQKAFELYNDQSAKEKWLKNYDQFCVEVIKKDVATHAGYTLAVITSFFFNLLFMKRKGIV